MLSENCELVTKEIVTKLLHFVRQHQTLLLNDIVVVFQLCESPTGIRNNMAILFEDNTKTYSTRIYLQLERCSGGRRSWVTQEWSLSDLGLQQVKRRLTISIPDEGDPFLC